MTQRHMVPFSPWATGALSSCLVRLRHHPYHAMTGQLDSRVSTRTYRFRVQFLLNLIKFGLDCRFTLVIVSARKKVRENDTRHHTYHVMHHQLDIQIQDIILWSIFDAKKIPWKLFDETESPSIIYFSNTNIFGTAV